MTKQLGILLLCLSGASFVFAATATPRPKNFTLRYASSTWNTSSKTMDSAFMFMRDKNSGKVAKILVEETEPDSSLFSGQFVVDWGTEKAISPEAYVPPQNMRYDPKAISKFNSMLQNNEISAQPLVVRDEKGKQILDVYDTDEQASRAAEAYKQEKEAIKQAEQAKLVKPKATESDIQVAKMAEQAALVAKLAKEAAMRETARIRDEQLELQRREKQRKTMEKMAAAEKAKRKKLAEQLVQKAVAHYTKSEYTQAEKLFSQAVELDPANDSHYFMYGVSLYRVEKFDDSLVKLKIAKTKDHTQELERKYYLGLIHYRLKELKLAAQNFKEVREANNPVMSPSAAFYEGLANMMQEEYVPAQAAFEYVIDNSSDANMDKKAEEYIEQIARILQFKRIAAQKVLFNASFGPSYDSNILLLPDNADATAGSASSKSGTRLNTSLGGEYRFFYREASELSTKLAFSNITSSSSDFASADPSIMTFTLPYVRKGIMSNKGYKLTVSPGYETIFMDYNSSGSASNILNTFMSNFDLMLVMNDNWFSAYNAEIRSDDSLIKESADANGDALKISVKKTETLFLDNSKKRAAIGYLGYVVNNAKGEEKKYNRVDFGAIYTAPLLKWSNTTWNGGLTGYILNYPETTPKRRDTDMALILGITRVLSETWSWSSSLTYTNNSSTDEDNTYSKYMAIATINYSWGQ